MEELEKLYYAALAKEGIKELTDRFSQVKFKELCQRAIDNNPELDFEDKVIAAHLYLKFLLRNPNPDL